MKQAFLFIAEDSLTVAATDTIAVKDDTGTPQTIVSALTLVAGTHDNGAWTELTVADEGPILNNAEIFLFYENNSTGEAAGICVLLWVSPTFAPSGLDGPL